MSYYFDENQRGPEWWEIVEDPFVQAVRVAAWNAIKPKTIGHEPDYQWLADRANLHWSTIRNLVHYGTCPSTPTLTKVRNALQLRFGVFDASGELLVETAMPDNVERIMQRAE